MRYRYVISAVFLLSLVFETAGPNATSQVLFSNVLVELVPELAHEIAGAMAACISTTTELLRPLEDFPPSEPLTGDDLRHVVRFAGRTDVSATAGRAMAIWFNMKNAELYSFAFRGEPQPATLKKTPEKLAAGQTVKVVCLGDSVTGIYYHTGGRRAYPEMLQLALRMTYPNAEVTVVNAGISGNRTHDGLSRLQQDVLDHQPDLVTVMFGLNDLTVLPIADFRANLTEIIRRCRAAGAEVLLCTPNSIITTSSRPVPKLVEYCQAVKEVGAEQQTPVCDIYAAYEALHARDPLTWRLLLSDEIHPNMDGHKLNAETIGRAITGQEVSLTDVGPPQPALPKTLALVKAGKPVRVLAMEPLDIMIATALTRCSPTRRSKCCVGQRPVSRSPRSKPPRKRCVMRQSISF